MQQKYSNYIGRCLWSKLQHSLRSLKGNVETLRVWAQEADDTGVGDDIDFLKDENGEIAISELIRVSHLGSWRKRYF